MLQHKNCPSNYKGNQPQFSQNACHPHDWLVEIHGRFECMSETLILDRCLLALAAAHAEEGALARRHDNDADL
jgi:hypothetical protein